MPSRFKRTYTNRKCQFATIAPLTSSILPVMTSEMTATTHRGGKMVRSKSVHRKLTLCSPLNISPSFTFCFSLLCLFALNSVNAQHFSTSSRSSSEASVIYYPAKNAQTIEIQNIEYDNGETLYIGVKNRILQLNVSTMRLVAQFETGPSEDTCFPTSYRCSEESSENSVLIDNYNILLLYDNTYEQLIACGNVGQGSCFSLRSTNVSILVAKSETHLEILKRGSPNARCKSLTYPDDRGNVLFVSTCDAPPLSGYNDFAQFTTSVRNLNPKDRLLQFHFVDYINSRYSIYKITEMVTKQIKVVSTFSIGMFVYVVETGFKMESKAIEDNPRTTRIARYSRQDSPMLFTYAEIPLTCKDSSGTEYSVASAMTVVKEPPSGLRAHLGGTSISARSEVLLAVFTTSSPVRGNFQDSIVCGFRIDEIDEVFTKLIKNCFAGIGKQGFGSSLLHDCVEFEEELSDEKMLVRPYDDPYNTNILELKTYPENFMGEYDKDLVIGKEIMAYKDELLTGIAVTVVGEFTNILLTTSEGKLKKASFKGENESLKEYFASVIFNHSNPSINSDIVHNVEQNFIVAFSETQLIKMPLYDCDAQKTCDTCVSLGGPYCGWCTLQDRCTSKSDCRDVEKRDPNAWIAYEDKCITIKEVTPKMVSIHYSEPSVDREIRLTVTRLPLTDGYDSSRYPSFYYCDFGGDDRDGRGSDQTRFRLDSGSTERGSCGVPAATSFLKTVPTGQAFLSVVLSIVTEVDGRKLNLTSKLVKFYDCAALSNCIECTSSKFECDWCLSSGKCVNSKLAGDGSAMADACEILNRIFGEQSSTKTEEQHNKRGNEYCPQVTYPTEQHKAQHFHVATKPTLFELSFKNIPDVVQALATKSLWCVVQQPTSLNVHLQTPFSSITSTPSTIMASASDYFVQKIPAHVLDGYTDRVQCSASDGLAIRGDYSSVTASVTLQWGHKDLTADNPDFFTVELYNCSKLASSCGECLSYVDPKFDCGYCQSSPTGYCTIKSQCDNTFITNNPENICLNPTIASFTPKSGPKTGGTLINITGVNLGRTVDNIGRIYIETEQASINCLIERELYMPAKSIVCKTSDIKQNTEGRIMVEMIMRESTFIVQSDSKFRFRSPRIKDFNPKRGPLDGGTRVIINGSDLDAGSELTVYIANYKCEVLERWATWLVCITGPAKRVDDGDKIKIKVDGAYIEQPIGLSMYKYLANPVITEINPLSTIQFGGISVNVTGKNLDIVQYPKIRLITSEVKDKVESSSSYTGPTGPCKSVSSTLMTCILPEAPRYYSFHGGAADSRNLQRRDVHDGFLTKFLVGFVMDDVVSVRVVPNQLISVYANPDFEFDDRAPSGILNVESRYTIHEFIRSQTLIYVGANLCTPIRTQSNNKIRCQIHQNWVGKSAKVTILVGNTFVRRGQILGEDADSTFIVIFGLRLRQNTIIIAIIAIGVFLIISFACLISCVICMCKRYRNNSAKVKRLIKDLEKINNPQKYELMLQPLLPNGDQSHLDRPPVNEFTEYVAKLLFCDERHPVFLRDPSHFIPNEINGGTPSSSSHPFSSEPNFYHAYSGVADAQVWLSNKIFLTKIMHALEADPNCDHKSKSEFVALLMVAFKHDMTYLTDVMEEMVKTMIDDAYKARYHPNVLFRRAERMAEKMVYNWLVFTMYDEVKQEPISKSLYELYWFLKHVIESGPLDQVSARSVYTLNIDYMFEKTLTIEKVKLAYEFNATPENKIQGQIEVPILDSVPQLKSKILDDVYRNWAYSKRPQASDYFLVVRSRQTESDEVITEEYFEARNHDKKIRKLRTAKELSLSDEHVLTLRDRSQGETSFVPHANGMNGYQRLPATPLLRIKDAWSTLRFPKTNALYYDNEMGPSGESQPEFYHLETPDAVLSRQLDEHERRCHFFRRERCPFGKNKKKKEKKEQKKKLRNEIKGMRELIKAANTDYVKHTKEATKETIKKFFKTILYVEEVTVVPFPIRYLFDILSRYGKRSDHIRLWKSNCVIAGFWVKLIERPDRLLDVQRVKAVELSLQTVSEALTDASSFDKVRYRSQDCQNIPRNKYLFFPTIPEYNDYIKHFFDRFDGSMKPIPAFHRNDFLSAIAYTGCNDNNNQMMGGGGGHPPNFMQQTPQFYNAPPQQSEWETRYKINAFQLIYDKYILPYANAIGEQLMGEIDEAFLLDFQRKTQLYQDSASSSYG